MLTPEESGVNFDQRIDTFQIQRHPDERFSLTVWLLSRYFLDNQVEHPFFLFQFTERVMINKYFETFYRMGVRHAGTILKDSLRT